MFTGHFYITPGLVWSNLCQNELPKVQNILKYVFVAESFHLLHKDITFVAYLEIFIFYQCTTLRKFVWALYIYVLNLSSIYPIFAHNHKEPHM